MKSLGLKGKLITFFLMAGLIPLLIVGVYSYKVSSQSLQEEAVNKLVAVRNIKGAAVKRYFETIKSQVLTFSQSVSTKNAMNEFNQAFKNYNAELELSSLELKKYELSLKNYYANKFEPVYLKNSGSSINSVKFLEELSQTSIALQYHYIAANPNPLGNKEALEAAPDKSNYSKVHEKYHPSIRRYLKEFGYYDIFLIDITTGHIVYSVFKELDFATSLVSGPYKNTNFAQTFHRAKKITSQKEFVLVDYQKYTPSYEAPASFIAAPIWDKGKKIGVLVFQMPIDRLNAIMGNRTGMGETGETYLFGQDKLMRSDSFLDNQKYNVVSSFKNSQQNQLNSISVNHVLEGKSGEIISYNYLGQEVISAYTPIDILGLQWGLIAEKSTDESFKSVRTIKLTLFIMTGISFILIIIFALMMSSKLSRRIQSIADSLLNNANEVATSSQDISISSTQLSNASHQASSSMQQTASSIDEIRSMVQKNADAANNSAQASSQSSDAANQGKYTVQSMIKSINDISKSNDEIAVEMQRNNEEISNIINVIAAIGEKTKVINEIVFQTKLLSFNASVEAARAGEHGKGFAVVAEEVGNLASLSGKASLEITDMLDDSIQKVTQIVESTKEKIESLIQQSQTTINTGTEKARECGEALDRILQNTTAANEMVREIASASNEQAVGIEQVTKAMHLLDETTNQNTSVAQSSSHMATKLKNQADSLNQAVFQLTEVIKGKKQSINKLAS